MVTKKKGPGGKRPGAGRPRGSTSGEFDAHFNTKCREDQLVLWRAKADDSDAGSFSEWVRRALDAYAESQK